MKERVLWRELMAALAVRPPVQVVPALRHHIDHVVRRRADEQMRWIDAARIVARVASYLAFWNGAANKLPPPPIGAPSPAVHKELAVAFRAFASGPGPAIVGAARIDLRP